MAPIPGILSTMSFKEPICWDRFDLREEIVQGEVPLHHSSGFLLGVLLIDDSLKILNQAYDIPHSEHATRHAVGSK